MDRALKDQIMLPRPALLSLLLLSLAACNSAIAVTGEDRAADTGSDYLRLTRTAEMLAAADVKTPQLDGNQAQMQARAAGLTSRAQALAMVTPAAQAEARSRADDDARMQSRATDLRARAEALRARSEQAPDQPISGLGAP